MTQKSSQPALSSESQTPIVVGIAAKPGHPMAASLASDLVRWLTERNIELRIDAEVAPLVTGVALTAAQIVERKELTKVANPIVVLGGDGTLISVCRHPSESSPVVIGVNLGSLGFLTEFNPDSFFPVLEAVLEGRAEFETRNLLSAVVRSGAKQIGSFAAFNDVVITKELLARLVAMDLWVNGQYAARIRGDGIIVSSPSGSTAYSLSAGGSIVHPAVDALLVTPICPHSLTSRPLVLPGNSKIRLVVASSGHSEVFLTVDGQVGIALDSGDELEVMTSKYSVRFVRFAEQSYFDTLAGKLKWGHA